MARHFAANFVNLLIVLLVAASGVVYWAKTQFKGLGPLTRNTCIEVPKGDTIGQLADRLVEKGVISNASVFRIGAQYSDLSSNLRFGIYELPAQASQEEILRIVTGGHAGFTYVVTYRIGIRSASFAVSERTGDDMERLAVIGVEEGRNAVQALTGGTGCVTLRVTVAEGATSWQVQNALNQAYFLVPTEEPVPAEGMLSPSTYDVSPGEPVDAVISRMLESQKRILAEEWANRKEDLPVNSPEEALILASIIEKETGLAEEKPEVAAVFVNRLNKGMKLQMDSTVEYGLTSGQGFLGRGLRRSELLKKTPYNTYLTAGLPPGPISNPGRDAIRAVLNPNTSNNLFFVADGTGGHRFAETLVQHNRNVAAWRKIEAEQKRNHQNSTGTASFR
ncbi:MAG: endolytic transglycosylase MltG [Rhodobacteraceae bacterium]|nr:endolytic transglycosylase MltG [Paracoccaceae bacterium]